MDIVGPPALFLGVPLAVMASGHALRDRRDPIMARAGFVIAVIEAQGVLAAVTAGLLSDALASP
jgi:hypothetical protein